MPNRFFLGAVAMVGLFSCRPRPAEPRIAKPHSTAQRLESGVGQVGQACGSNADCASELCLHFKPDPLRDRGWACSSRCSASPCADGWKCVQYSNDPDGQLCMPPQDWDYRVAEFHLADATATPGDTSP